MSKFKVGDWVKIKTDDYNMLKKAKGSKNSRFQIINIEDKAFTTEIYLKDDNYPEEGMLMLPEELKLDNNAPKIRKKLGVK